MNTPTIAPPTKPDATTMPSLQLWSKIAQTPELVGYFDGVFGKAGISVEESGEEFTVTNQGNGFALSPGIDKDVDFIVPVKQENITRLAEHAVKGAFDPHQSWRIVRVLFTPLTRAALQSPTVRKNWIRLLSGVEAVLHVYLVDPSSDANECHTLAYAGDQWLVIPGLHGKAERTYWLNPDQALTFQRQLYQALKTDTMGGWWQFANWYRAWRQVVSKTE